MHKFNHQITQPRTTQALSQIFPAKFFLFLYANIVTTPQDSPPSVNRLLGVRWVSHLVSGKPIAEFTKEVQMFYHLFYQIELTAEQATQLLHDVK